MMSARSLTALLLTISTRAAAGNTAPSAPASAPTTTTTTTAPAAAPAADARHFVTIGRLDASSRAGIEASYVFLPATVATGVTALRFEAHGQYFDPSTRLGAYATIPLGYARGGGSVTSLGDVELGGYYAPRLIWRDLAVVLHAGLTLPTQSDDMAKVSASFYTGLPRLADFYLSAARGLSLRVGASPTWRAGRMFARCDVGLDANLHAARGEDLPDVLRVGLGAGVQLDRAAVMAELSNLYIFGAQGGPALGWVDVGAVSARFDAGTLQPYAALTVGIDRDARSAISEGVTLGLEGRLP